jgi:hypothetical protein
MQALKRANRWVIPSALLLTGSIALAGESTIPRGRGTFQEGAIEINLRRGAGVPMEFNVIATPDGCANEMVLDLTWSEEDDDVTAHIVGHHVLVPHPTLTRTEGVDFFPNPFFPQPKDIVDGRYQFWIISAGGPPITLFYDGMTTHLLGTQFDFATPPPGSVPIQLPTLMLVPSPFFQPDDEGNIDQTFHWKYSGMLRQDLPTLANHFFTVAPPTLCDINPFRLDLSFLRPLITNARPASEALPFSDFVRNGLIFDITVDPPTYFTNPPLTTLTSSYSNTTAVAGTVPRGWGLDIDAAFGNVAPPIKPFIGAGRCQQEFTGVHTHNINFCAPH